MKQHLRSNFKKPLPLGMGRSHIFKGDLSKIKKINVRILKDYPDAKGYDDAFANLYKNGVVNLVLTPFYDKNKMLRRSAIAHELEHVRQMIQGELVFKLGKNKKEYIWKGEVFTKVYSYKKFDSLNSRKSQINYISKICPWERTPSLLADKFSES